MNNFILLRFLLLLNPSIELSWNYQSPNTYIFKSNEKTPLFNKICNPTIPTDQEVLDIISFFKDIPFMWVVDAQDTKTINILIKNNLVHRATAPAMQLRLTQFKPKQYSENITIKEITPNDSTMKEWIEQIAQSHNLTQEQVHNYFKIIYTKSAQSIHLFQGFFNNKPVSTGMTIEHNADIVSIHWISTLPEYQGKGLGSAITQEAIIHAKNTGHTQAILIATAQGYPLYEKLGFTVYTTYHYYSNGSWYSIIRMLLHNLYNYITGAHTSCITPMVNNNLL